jgi:methionine aminopeptidase
MRPVAVTHSDSDSFCHLGIGFPTAISLNNCVAHFSPIASDPEAATELKEGDVAKM